MQQGDSGSNTSIIPAKAQVHFNLQAQTTPEPLQTVYKIWCKTETAWYK